MATHTAERIGWEDESAPTVTLDASSGDDVRLPDGIGLFGAELIRAGSDLVVIDDGGAEAVILDYFATDDPPDLLAAGGRMTPDVVRALAGARAPGEYAQAEGDIGAQPIGTIETVDGLVLVTRVDGVQVAATAGDPIFQGDVIDTNEDGSVFAVFLDGTSFAMGQDSRVVLDELIYDPATAEGSAVFTALEGTFSFVSGDIAKSDPDAMIIKTPVAICGVRGTKVGIKVAETGETYFALLEEGIDISGEIILSNLGGSEVLNLANQVSIISNELTAPSAPQVYSPDQISDLFGASFEALYRQDFRLSEADLGDIAPEAGGQQDDPSGTLGFTVDPNLVGGGGGGGDPLNAGTVEGGGTEPGTTEFGGRPTTLTTTTTTAATTATTPDLLTAAGSEDGAIPIDVSPLLVNFAGTVTVVFEGVPDGATLSLGAATGAGTWALSETTEAELAGLTFQAPENFGGNLQLTVSVGAGAGGGATTSATLEVEVASVADAPALAVAPARGVEDSAIPLAVTAALADVDGSETLDVTITGIPDGAILGFNGATVAFDPGGVSDDDNTATIFDVTSGQLAGLSIKPPPDSDANFTLTVVATARESDSQADTVATLTVEVDPLADVPTITVQNAEGETHGAIPLDVAAGLTDTDGSEALSVTVRNVPDGAQLSAGINAGDGTWTLAPGDLVGLSVTPVPGSTDDFTLAFTATATEAGGGSASSEPTLLDVIVSTALPKVLLSTAAIETPLDLGAPDFPAIAEGEALSPDDIQGVDPDNLTVGSAGALSVTFIAEGAGFRSTVGWYTVGAGGEILNPRIIWENVSALGSGGALEPGVSTVELGGVETGDQVGFFLIANGFSVNNKYAGIDFDAGTLAFAGGTIFDAAPALEFTPDGGGDAVTIAGEIYHTAARGETVALNSDSVQHAISGADPVTGELLIGFEDLKGGGDNDYGDVIVRLDQAPDEVTTLTPTAIDPNLLLVSPNSGQLSSAVVAIVDGAGGDRLALDDSLFTISNGVIDGTAISVTGQRTDSLVFEGIGSTAEYQSLLQAIQFENPLRDPATGFREVSFSVTDTDGNESPAASVAVELADPIGLDGTALLEFSSGDDAGGDPGSDPDEILGEGYTVFADEPTLTIDPVIG